MRRLRQFDHRTLHAEDPGQAVAHAMLKVRSLFLFTQYLVFYAGQLPLL